MPNEVCLRLADPHWIVIGFGIQRTEGRLQNRELHLNTGATVSGAQAPEIAQAVEYFGQCLASQGDNSGYAKVYSEMHRR